MQFLITGAKVFLRSGAPKKILGGSSLHIIDLLWCRETLINDVNKLAMSKFVCSKGRTHLRDSHADILNINFFR